MADIPDRFSPFFAKLKELASIPEQEIQRILPLLSHRSLEKGEYFVRRGDVATTIGFMASGLIRYFYVADSGKEIIRYFCEGKSFVSSYTSVLKGTPSLYAIQALERTFLITIRATDWFGLSQSHPVWGTITQAIQAYALTLAEKREYALVSLDAKARYLQFLEDFPGLENRLKQYDIASYLGITPVALSRIRSFPAKN